MIGKDEINQEEQKNNNNDNNNGNNCSICYYNNKRVHETLPPKKNGKTKEGKNWDKIKKQTNVIVNFYRMF